MRVDMFLHKLVTNKRLYNNIIPINFEIMLQAAGCNISFDCPVRYNMKRVHNVVLKVNLC